MTLIKKRMMGDPRKRDALAEEDEEEPEELEEEDEATSPPPKGGDNAGGGPLIPKENPVKETERYTSDGTVIASYDVAGDEAIVAAPPEVIPRGGDPTLPKGDGERHNTNFVNMFQPPMSRYTPIRAIPFMKGMN